MGIRYYKGSGLRVVSFLELRVLEFRVEYRMTESQLDKKGTTTWKLGLYCVQALGRMQGNVRFILGRHL